MPEQLGVERAVHEGASARSEALDRGIARGAGTSRHGREFRPRTGDSSSKASAANGSPASASASSERHASGNRQAHDRADVLAVGAIALARDRRRDVRCSYARAALVRSAFLGGSRTRAGGLARLERSSRRARVRRVLPRVRARPFRCAVRRDRSRSTRGAIAASRASGASAALRREDQPREHDVDRERRGQRERAQRHAAVRGFSAEASARWIGSHSRIQSRLSWRNPAAPCASSANAAQPTTPRRSCAPRGSRASGAPAPQQQQQRERVEQQQVLVRPRRAVLGAEPQARSTGRRGPRRTTGSPRASRTRRARRRDEREHERGEREPASANVQRQRGGASPGWRSSPSRALLARDQRDRARRRRRRP